MDISSLNSKLLKLKQIHEEEINIMTGAERSYARIPFEPSSNEKFFISEITGTKTDKNDVRFYKVKWQQTWIPASRIRAWQDLIIQFWEGYHTSNDQKVMEIDSPCDQTPQVYVLTSDSESREELQVVAPSNSDKHERNTEQDNSSSVNFDTYNDEENSDVDRTDDMYLDSEKISILGHKRMKILKQRQPRPVPPTSEPNEHLPPPPPLQTPGTNDEEPPEPQYMDHERATQIKQEITTTVEREREREREREDRREADHLYNPFTRLEGLPTHVPPEHRSFPMSMEKPLAATRDLYGSPNYRLPSALSPNTGHRDPHELQVVSTYSVRRNSASPHNTHNTHGVYEENMPTHKKTFFCYLCGKEYRSGTGLKQHLLAHKNEKPFGCNICQRRYRWKGDLNRHMYTHLPNNELPLKCPECNKGFVRKDKMQLHINFAHGGGSSGTTGTPSATGNTTEESKPFNIKPPLPLNNENNNGSNNHYGEEQPPAPLLPLSPVPP